MLFQSQFYVLVFLPLTVALYYAAARSAAARQWVLITASLFFYGWWDPRFIILVLVFPHVIAGPIVRHNELVPQFALSPLREGMWARIGAGLVIFTVGFAKKVLLADRLAPTVDQLFSQATQRVLDFGEAWTAALAFSFQLFLDFSAYTEMAIGSALLFGLVLPENFRRPYLSTDLRD